jgi:hypothetical protein
MTNIATECLVIHGSTIFKLSTGNKRVLVYSIRYSVSDPHRLYADPDTAFEVNADPSTAFKMKRIRIQPVPVPVRKKQTKI